MNSWFYSSFPQTLYDRLSEMTRIQPVDTAHGAGWLGCGAMMMAALLFCRQYIFWLPHPIGMIMLVNPIMITYWFSIFIGWLAKSLVTKYGNKDTYSHMRNVFIGLIVGELLIIFLALLVTNFSESGIRPIDLNRN